MTRNPGLAKLGGALALGALLPAFAASPALAASGDAPAPSEAVLIGGIVVILLVARVLGEAMQRLGQPAVIGQLIAGVLLGPSFLGLLWPQTQQALFPHEAAQKAMLDAIGQFGVLLLLLLTGMDVDVRLIRRVGRAAVSVSIMGIALPFIGGLSLGLLLPDALLPRPETRLVAALFLGVALSISSVKIVAMVVREMNFTRRDLGQIIVASAIIEDSIGWIIIAVVFGVARAGKVEIYPTLQSVAGVAVFLALSFTVGRRAVSAAIRFVNDSMESEFPVITLILIIMGGMALITHALGVQTVLGAFVAGILVGESPILTKHIDDRLRAIVVSFFAPIFFALAGLSADLTVLKSPGIAALTLGLVLIATIGKFGGAFAGGIVGRLSGRESTALAIGMNARGWTEVIVASIGLSLGLLSQNLYTMIVTMAVLTTIAMPPTLRWALSRAPMRKGEQERLDREAFEARGFVDNMERLLLAVSDNPNGRLASRIAGLLAGRRGLPTTILHIQSAEDESAGAVGAAAESASEMTANVKDGADQARHAPPAPVDGEVASLVVKTRSESEGVENAVAVEGPKGYDFLIVGLDPARTPEGGFSLEIARTARAYDGPLMVVVARGGHKDDPLRGRLNVLVPVTGTDTSKHAAEAGIEIARSANANITILHVASPQLASEADVGGRRRMLERRYEEAVLKDIVEIADHHNVAARTKVVVSNRPDVAIRNEAARAGATLVVLGVSTRPTEALLFGNTAGRLLDECKQSLLFVAS